MPIYNIEPLPADGTMFNHQGRVYFVGAIVDYVGVVNLPVGTTVYDGLPSLHNRQRWFTKMTEGVNDWLRNDCVASQGIASDYNTLRSFPTPEPPDYDEIPLPMVQRLFAGRVREVAAKYSPAHVEVAEEVLADLSSVNGEKVYPFSTPEEGTVAAYTKGGEERWTEFVYADGVWGKVRGHYSSMLVAGECEVVSSPGQKAYADIGEWRAAVWAAGQQAKQEQRWCSAYDKLLAEFGITDPEPRPDFSEFPDLVKGVEARANLPVGAVLGVDRGDWGIFVKATLGGEPQDDNWVRVAGTRPRAAGTMRLLYPGDGVFVHAASLQPWTRDILRTLRTCGKRVVTDEPNPLAGITNLGASAANLTTAITGSGVSINTWRTLAGFDLVPQVEYEQEVIFAPEDAEEPF